MNILPYTVHCDVALNHANLLFLLLPCTLAILHKLVVRGFMKTQNYALWDTQINQPVIHWYPRECMIKQTDVLQC